MCVILISCQNHERGEGRTEYGVYIANADGSNPIKIRDDFDIGTQFTPDDQKIILGGGESSIRIMNIDGSDYRDIELHCNGIFYDFPIITNDSRKIIYSANISSNVYGSNIFVYDIFNYNISNLTNTTKISCKYPTLSRDQKYIAYTTQEQDSLKNTITIMNIDGTSRRVLLCLYNQLSSPFLSLRFSPEGNGIYYISGTDINYLNISTLNSKRIVCGTKGIFPISFSISGDKLIYSTRSGVIYLVNTKTLMLTKIVNGYCGTISQDGNYVIYQTENSYSDLNILNLTTNQIRRVAQNAGFANFSYDGTKIVYIIHKTVYDKNITK